MKKEDKVLGIIVEYNPLHNGHVFHLKKSIEKTNAKYVVAVMSGNFVQRGEPSIVDKFDRTKVAIKCGINLVLELPAIYAIQDAGGFACGSVGILHRSNVIDHLIFGSESSDIDTLENIAEILTEKKILIRQLEKNYMKSGFSYPNARKFAIKEFMDKNTNTDFLEDIISKSNDILGLEYIKWLKKYDSNIKPDTIKRIGADYNEKEFRGEFSSATAIRKMTYSNKWELVETGLPKEMYDILCEYHQKGGFVKHEDLTVFFKTFFLARNRDHLKRYYGVSEGLEKRFTESVRKSSTDSFKDTDSLNDILSRVKSKRFTYSRLKRTLLYMLFEIEDEIIKDSEKFGPQYLRILGFDSKGREILADIRHKSSIPIISTPSTYNKVIKKYLQSDEDIPQFFNEDLFRKQIEMDFRISDFYHHLKYGKHNEYFDVEMKRSPIIM